MAPVRVLLHVVRDSCHEGVFADRMVSRNCRDHGIDIADIELALTSRYLLTTEAVNLLAVPHLNRESVCFLVKLDLRLRVDQSCHR
jgi:hypothetical protein